MNKKNTEKGLLLQAPKKKKLPVWTGAISVILILAAGTYFLLSSKPYKSSRTIEKVSIGISKAFLSIPVYIAKEQGYFPEEGLELTLKEYASGKKAIQAMFKGETNISTAADIPVVFNSFTREDFCITATFASSYHMVKIITHKERGIEEGADLRGRRVGVNLGTSSQFFLSLFLLHNRLLPSEIEMVNIKTVDMPIALKNNEVDAIAVWQPYIQATKKLLQDKAVELSSSEIYRTTFNFTVMKTFSEKHPEILRRFLRAIDKAVIFMRTNRDRSQDIIAQRFELDRNTIDAIWDDFNFQLSLDQTLLLTWDEIADWAMKRNLADQKAIPNYLNFICIDILDEVKPETITIIR